MRGWLKARPLWQRIVILAALLFVAGVMVRLAEPLGWLLLLLGLFAVGWVIAGGFKRRETAEGSKNSIVRGLLMIPVGLLAVAVVFPTGGITGEAIKPLSDQELAERDRLASERAAQEAREAEAQAEAQAEEEAVAQAEAKLQAEAQAEEEAVAQAEAKLQAEAQAEEEAVAQAEADSSRLLDLRENKPLIYVQEVCKNLDAPLTPYYQVDPAGESAFLTTLSASDEGGISALTCVQFTLEWSQPFLSTVSSTSALAGTRTWSEKGLSYQWTYHPDSGLNMSIVRD